MQIFCKSLTGKEIGLNVEPTYTIRQCKYLVEKKLGTLIKHQRMIFTGILLKDEKTLADYNIQKESIIHLVLNTAGYNFNDLKKMDKHQVCRGGPKYLTIQHGVNFVGKCHNPHCETQKNEGMFIIKKGYGVFEIVEEKKKQIYCSICHQTSEFRTIGFTNCKFSYSGFQSSYPIKELTGNGLVERGDFRKFNSDNNVKWNKLTIRAENIKSDDMILI